MTEFLLHLGWLTLSISSVILLILLFNRIFGGKFSAKSRYIVWTVVVLSLCIGAGMYRLPALFTVEVSLPSFMEDVSDATLNPPAASDTRAPVTNTPSTMIPTNPITPNTNHSTTPDSNNAPNLNTTQSDDPQEVIVPAVPPIQEKDSFEIDIPTLIFGIWAFGAILYFSVSMAVYIRSTHKYARSKKICDAETEGLFRTMCRRYKIKRIPRLYVCSAAGSPVLYGYTKPTILLPDIKLTPNSLVGVLAHELTHYRRGDIWVKLICLMAESLYWFNPLVYAATSRCNAEMELSCDEAVLAGMNEDVRRSYGNVMLEIVKHCARKRSTLTTQFNPHKNAVKERILNILDMTKKKRGRVIIAVTLVLCIIAGTIIGCGVNKDDINENEEIDKLIDSITYVDFSSESSGDGFIPVSYIQNGVQLIAGDLGLEGAVLANAPKVDTLKKTNGIASDGEWNFFPYEVKHTEYTYDNQPENKEWTDYYRTMLAKDTPIIITDVYSLEQNGVQIDVVTASNIVMNGDIAKLYTKDDTYPTPNVPQSERTSIYIICAVFIEGQEPTKLYELSESFLTINDMGGISCDPTVYSEYFQQIYSTLQYDVSGEVSVCPIYCNMNGELNLRSYMNKPTYVIADIDGDGKVELVEYRDRLSSDMSICIIYDYTNDGYVRQASVKAGPDTPNTPVANNESTTQYTFELTDHSRPNDTPSTFSILTPSNWVRSGDLDVLAETLTFSSGVSESKKRMEVTQYNDLQILLSKDGGDVNNKIVVLDPDEVTSGITENGYKYIYYREGIFNEDTEPYALYHFYIDPENGRQYLVSFITFLDCDTADYFETVILPAVNSVVITQTTDAQTETVIRSADIADYKNTDYAANDLGSETLEELFAANSIPSELTQFLNKTFSEIETAGYSLEHLQGNNGWAGWPNYSISGYDGVTLTFRVSYDEATKEHLTNVIPDGVEITNPDIAINGLRVSMTGEEAKKHLASWNGAYFSHEQGGRNYVTTYNNNSGYELTAYWAMPEETYKELGSSIPPEADENAFNVAKEKLIMSFTDNPAGEILCLRIRKAPTIEQSTSSENQNTGFTLQTYMHELVAYLHEPFEPGEAQYPDSILGLVFEYCFYSKDALEGVTVNEETFGVAIDGEVFRTVAKSLFGDDFTVSGRDLVGGRYDEANDTYTTSYSKDYWGGDRYTIEWESDIIIEEKDSKVIVTAMVGVDDEVYGTYVPFRKLEYTFTKVKAAGCYHYRLEKITETKESAQTNSDPTAQGQTSTYIQVDTISALPKDPSEAWKTYEPMMAPIYYFFDNGLTYYCRYEYKGVHYEKNTLFLPEGYTNGEIFYVRGTGGSASMYIIVKTDQGYLRYYSTTSHYPDEILSVNLLTDDELEYEKSCMENDQMWVTPEPAEVFDPEAFAELLPGGSIRYEFYHQLMPAPAQTYLYFCSVRQLNNLGTAYTDDPPREFRVYAKQADDNLLYSVEATLPDDLEYDSVLPVLATHGGGSLECRFFLRLTNGSDVFYISFDNFEWTDDYRSFKYRGIVSDDELSDLALQ